MFINIPAKNSFAKYKPKQWNFGRVRRSQSFVPFTEHWEEIDIVFYEGNLLKQGRKNMDSRFPAQQFSICLC
ncbi:hypothetical protein T06_7000 [Trichinella sp. T6]|nr:hypothetical protein T06_7000 [Trichinella sp. T6]